MRRITGVVALCVVGALVVAAATLGTAPEIEFPSFPSAGEVVGRDVDQARGLRLTGDLAWTRYRIEEPWASAYPRVQRDLAAQGFRTVSETPEGTRWFRARDRRGAYAMKERDAAGPRLREVHIGRRAAPAEALRVRFTRLFQGR